jgi:hypothetical protein
MSFCYLMKNSYNLLEKFRRNTISILMSPTSLYKNAFEKNQDTDIYFCTHCLIKNLSMRNF